MLLRLRLVCLRVAYNSHIHANPLDSTLKQTQNEKHSDISTGMVHNVGYIGSNIYGITVVVLFRITPILNKKEIEMEHENINKQEDAQLGIGGVSISALTEWLKSESVYTALRYAAKNPSNSGMDNCEDKNYLHLYNLICQIRRD